MLKQLIFVALLVVAANCDESQPDPSGEPETQMEAPPVAPPSSQPNRMEQLKNFGTGLADLGLVSAKHLGRWGQESRPLFDKFGRAVYREAKDIGQMISSSNFVNENKKVASELPAVKAVKPVVSTITSQIGTLLPYAGEGINTVVPIVNQGLKPLWSQMGQKGREFWASHQGRMAEHHKKNEPVPEAPQDPPAAQ